MKRLIVMMVLAVAALTAGAQSYKTVNDIPYSQADAYARERCKLDVYYPTDLKECPVVVWFHGGGLTGGNKFIP